MKNKKLKVEDLTGGEVQAIINKLIADRDLHSAESDDENWTVYSDLTDEEGNQYIDLVQEGGGVLGIALLGYTYVLEEFGFRFLSMAGTSAGAINTILLAAAGKPHEKRTKKILPFLVNKNLFDFVDTPDKRLKKLFELISKDKNEIKSKWFHKLKLGYYLAWSLDNILDLKQNYGFNPGINFSTWLEEKLAEFGINTTKELTDIMQPDKKILRKRTKDGKIEKLKEDEDIEAKLAIIATDITTQTKVEFPKMGKLYFKSSEDENPCKFVRASMSIPIFFEPHRVKNIPCSGEDVVNWQKLASYNGEIPKEVLFIDGGVVSNFPFDVFHMKNQIPRKPTFGVKLGIDRTKIFDTKKLSSLINHTFSAARQMNDFAFIQENKQEYEQLVKNIDTDGYNWIDFNLPNEKKKELFILGAKAVDDFIRDFHWKTYKQIREKKIQNFKSE